jgi:DNA-binding MarR family transcriptional regulator
VPLPGAGELTIVLAALAQPSRTSLYYLRLLTGLTGAVVDVCVARLEAAELVTSEHRSDGNELRRMVEITDAGRRALEDGDCPA